MSSYFTFNDGCYTEKSIDFFEVLCMCFFQKDSNLFQKGSEPGYINTQIRFDLSFRPYESWTLFC